VNFRAGQLADFLSRWWVKPSPQVQRRDTMFFALNNAGNGDLADNIFGLGVV
jgi:hypothetical protein